MRPPVRLLLALALVVTTLSACDEAVLNSVMIEIDQTTGLATSIVRVDRRCLIA